jgi:hypothetical protein
VIADLDAHIELGTRRVLVEISTNDVKVQACSFSASVWSA